MLYNSMQSTAELFVYLGLIFGRIICVSTAPYAYSNITIEEGHSFDEKMYDLWQQKYAQTKLELENDNIPFVNLHGITVVVDDENDWGFTDSDTFIVRSVQVNLIEDTPMDRCTLALGNDNFDYRVISNADGSCTIAVPIQDVVNFYDPRANRVRRVVNGRRRLRRLRRSKPSYSASVYASCCIDDSGGCGDGGGVCCSDRYSCGAEEVICDTKTCTPVCEGVDEFAGGLAGRRRRDVLPDEQPMEEVHSRVKRSGCDCQCSAFRTSSGAGNCRTQHQGRFFCYVSNTHDDCDDLRSSSSQPGRFWSFDACITPGRSSSQCRGGGDTDSCDPCCGAEKLNNGDCCA